MQDLEASDGVASTGTNATNTTNTATRIGRSVSNQLRFTQQNRITRRAFAQLKAKFRSRWGVALYRNESRTPGTSSSCATDHDNWVFPGVGESVSKCPPRLRTSSREACRWIGPAS